MSILRNTVRTEQTVLILSDAISSLLPDDHKHSTSPSPWAPASTSLSPLHHQSFFPTHCTIVQASVTTLPPTSCVLDLRHALSVAWKADQPIVCTAHFTTTSTTNTSLQQALNSALPSRLNTSLQAFFIFQLTVRFNHPASLH